MDLNDFNPNGEDGLSIPFMIEGGAFRGRMIRADGPVSEILARHSYPPLVNNMLAETVALALALAAMLKYDGIFTLQTKGDGPINTLVVDVTSTGDIRACARFDEEALAKVKESELEDGPVPHLLGAGHLAFTVDQGSNTQRYQGIVEMDGPTLGECMHRYFRQSEQLESAVRVAVNAPVSADDKRWRAGCILMQRMPEDGGVKAVNPADLPDDPDDSWRTAVVMLSSVTDLELVADDLPPPVVLNRLFHAHKLMVDKPRMSRFACRCSRERVDRVLAQFPLDELNSMRTDEGDVVVDCEYCGASYAYGDADLAALKSRS